MTTTIREELRCTESELTPIVNRLFQQPARLHPLDLNLLAAVALPFCFASALLSGQFVAAAIHFAVSYGAANGITTITRGTLPLVLFDHHTYGALTGKLLTPSFFTSSIAPVRYAITIEYLGEMGALDLSIALTVVTLICALILRAMFVGRRSA